MKIEKLYKNYVQSLHVKKNKQVTNHPSHFGIFIIFSKDTKICASCTTCSHRNRISHRLKKPMIIILKLSLFLGHTNSEDLILPLQSQYPIVVENSIRYTPQHFLVIFAPLYCTQILLSPDFPGMFQFSTLFMHPTQSYYQILLQK